MDRNDAELTRMAIEEILRDTKEQLGNNELPRPNQERKINPLGKTNKQFLGRTLNAIVKYNERTVNQNRQNCRKKLKELIRGRGRSRSSKRNIKVYSHKSKRRKTEEESSDSDDSLKRKKTKHSKSKRRKKQKHKKSERRNSSSSSISTNNLNLEERRPPNYEVLDNEVRYDATSLDMEAYSEQVSAWMMEPLLWAAQMQQLYQYKALIEMSSAQEKSTEQVQIEELSLSSSSLSDVNFEEVVESKPSLNIMLTINLSSDEDEEPNKMSSPPSKSLEKSIAKENSSIEVSDSDTNQLEEESAIIEVSDSDSDESTHGNQKTEENGLHILIGSKNNINHKSIESNSCIAFDLTDE